jgi:uncharacterized protein with HEPN domain
MSPRDWQARIHDILEAAREILVFTGEMDSDTFRLDVKTIRAVELNFIIIGDAANGMPDEVIDLHPGGPWHLMRSMRNRLVHVNFEVDPKLVWETVQNDIPALILSLENWVE